MQPMACHCVTASLMSLETKEEGITTDPISLPDGSVKDSLAGAGVAS